MNNFTESLKSKKIFLTGGTGLFGKWLLTALKDKFADIVILSRNPARFKKTFPLARTMGVKFIQGDIRSFEFPNDNFDYCIHGATPVVSGVHNIDQELEQQSIIIEGTRRVLELAKISNTGRLLYISSGAVYGVQPFDIKSLPETFLCNPVSLYGKAKLQAEKLCMDSNVDCVIARCFSFVGFHMPVNSHFAVENFIRACLSGKEIVISGNGKSRRSYMYSKDLAVWLIQIMLIGQTKEKYNVGSSLSLSIEEIANLVKDCAGTDSNIRLLYENNIPESNYVPDNSKAEREISLSQHFSLKDALVETIKHYKGFR